MKLIRYRKGKPEYKGVLENNTIKRINGTFFQDYSVTKDSVSLSDVEIMPPITPNKIIGMRNNYDKGAKPLFFIKPASTIIATGENIIYPENVEKVIVEAELAVVMGRRCRNISEEQAEKYILGYTIGNDVMAHGLEHGKCYDTFTPLGDVIETECDINKLEIIMKINDVIVQKGNSKDMYNKIPFLVSYLSSIMTLLPGDVILTGTPEKAVEVKAGDDIEILIEGVGALKNRISR